MNSTTVELSFHSYKLHAYVRHSTAAVPGKPHACIFYLHGGGLVFGVSSDLPELYQKLILSEGYDLICLDYPLAPEVGLTEILDAVHHSVSELLHHPELLGYDTMPPYLLFGRSAGAYLALMETKRLLQSESNASALLHPSAVLSFYGYHTFLLPEFQKPAPAYAKYTVMSDSFIASLTNHGIQTEGPAEPRFLIYLHARQLGDWTRFLGTAEELASCSLTEEDLKQFPPCFFTASTTDTDVPYRESKQMSRLVPHSKFHPVYYLEHDFDRDTTRKEGLEAYRTALNWLNTIL